MDPSEISSAQSVTKPPSAQVRSLQSVMEEAASRRAARDGDGSVAQSTAITKASDEAKPVVEKPWYDEIEPLKEREHLSPWHAMGLTYNTIYGISYQDFCNQFRGGKGAESLRKISQSPAGRRWAEAVEEVMDDPARVIQLLMNNHQLTGFGVHLQALNLATAAKDYKAMHQMVKDVALAPALSKVWKQPAKSEAAQAPVININMPAGAKLDLGEMIEPETIEVDVEMAEEEEEDERGMY